MCETNRVAVRQLSRRWSQPAAHSGMHAGAQMRQTAVQWQAQQEKRRDTGGLRRSQTRPRHSTGCNNLGSVHWNLSASRASMSTRSGAAKASSAEGGALRGPHRRPYRPLAQRQILRRGARAPRARIDWGKTNQPISPERFASLHKRLLGYVQGRELFVQDLLRRRRSGIPPAVRVVTETRLAQPVRAQHVHSAAGARSSQASSPPSRSCTLPDFQADPRARRHRVGLRHLGQFRRAARG